MNALLGLIPAWMWAVAVAALAATNCATSLQLERLKANHAEQASAQQAEARLKERTAAEQLATIQGQANDEKNALQRRVAALTDSLRNRPTRPADLPESPPDSMACTGASLFAEDGSFLIRESARADKLRVDLKACQDSYDQAVVMTQ